MEKVDRPAKFIQIAAASRSELFALDEEGVIWVYKAGPDSRTYVPCAGWVRLADRRLGETA